MTPKERPSTAAVRKVGQSKRTYESYFRTLGNLLDNSVNMVCAESDDAVLRPGNAATIKSKPKAKKLRRRPASSVGVAGQEHTAPQINRAVATLEPRRILSIRLSGIEIPAERRSRANQVVVDKLVTSIERRGLLSPIRLQASEDPDKYTIICGVKRFLAHEILGRTHIDAIVVDGDPTQLELDEIEENLVRHDLTVLERAECERRQKELYLVLYPDSHQGTAGARARHGLQTTHVSFAASHAAPGSGQRMVERRIQIAKALSPETQALLAESPIADKFRQLLELSRKPEGSRHAIAALIAEGKAKSVRAAERQLAGVPDLPTTPRDREARARLLPTAQGYQATVYLMGRKVVVTIPTDLSHVDLADGGQGQPLPAYPGDDQYLTLEEVHQVLVETVGELPEGIACDVSTDEPDVSEHQVTCAMHVANRFGGFNLEPRANVRVDLVWWKADKGRRAGAVAWEPMVAKDHFRARVHGRPTQGQLRKSLRDFLAHEVLKHTHGITRAVGVGSPPVSSRSRSAKPKSDQGAHSPETPLEGAAEATMVDPAPPLDTPPVIQQPDVHTGAGSPPAAVSQSESTYLRKRCDLMSGLINMGWKRNKVEAVVTTLASRLITDSMEDLFREALQLLGRRPSIRQAN